MSSPFEYPSAPLIRIHEPRGYGQSASFRPWLRDEFSFRCVSCLIRETWQPDNLQVEHFEPVSTAPTLSFEYGNLLYACRTCNEKKGSRPVSDPTRVLLQAEVWLEENGLLIGKTPQARELILLLGLNTRRQRRYRQLWCEVIQLAEKNNPELHRRLMGYPDNLPDLSILRPPGGNGKPEGIAASHHARRERGELPETY